ncbi:MAG: hypothetical protein J1F20_09030, partial [Muribaculaceae bacterium]|nr:hypothetical protein [Muribaculaceae bacterium]
FFGRVKPLAYFFCKFVVHFYYFCRKFQDSMANEKKTTDKTVWWGVGLIAFSVLIMWLFFL